MMGYRVAKELPYFKFEPAIYDTGSIQICSFEAQGVFINVCSMYWQRLGDLPYKLALQKICKGNATALDSLIGEDILKVKDGMICIDFLNEQLAEFENLSHTNRENARLGWEKRRLDATAKPSHSKPNAIRGEKIRVDEMKVDENIMFLGQISDLFFIVPSKYANQASIRINGTGGLGEFYEINHSIIKQPEFAERFLRAKAGSHFKDFTHLHNSYLKFIKDESIGSNKAASNGISSKSRSGDYSEQL